VSSADVMSSLKLGAEDLPAVFMVSEDDEGVQRYTGEILELNLSEWILKHSSPGMGELTLNSASGKTHHVHSEFAVRCWEVFVGPARCCHNTTVPDMVLCPLVYM
jgi:hypothetical protein